MTLDQTHQACSNKTELKDRTLFYDGDSVVSEQEIIDAVSAGQSIDGLFVSEITDEIRRYNSFVPPNQQIRIKDGVGELNYEWNLPEKYAKIDPHYYVAQKFFDIADTFPPAEATERKMRLIQELRLYEQLELIPILRLLIFIINTLEEKDLVWGVGRGSSVSSYVLYVLGVHDVDSFKYDLNIEDFLRI